MKFEDIELTSHNYRYKYLDFVDESVPEVYEDLKAFLPKYQKVFGSFDWQKTNNIFDCLMVGGTQDKNYILFNLDKNIRHSSSNAPQPNKTIILNNFLEFRQNYFEFIERFGLETDWLKRSLFTFLYFLMEAKHKHKLSNAISHGWNPYRGEPFLFEFDGWRIDEESKDFEKNVITAFNNYLRDYIDKTAQKASIQGYKKIRRPKNYERLKWLVRWTVQKRKMREIAEEFCVEERTIWNAFETFKKYDLPIRVKNKAESI